MRTFTEEQNMFRMTRRGFALLAKSVDLSLLAINPRSEQPCLLGSRLLDYYLLDACPV
mgnify:FL=1